MVERRVRRKPLVLASTQTLLDSLPGTVAGRPRHRRSQCASGPACSASPPRLQAASSGVSHPSSLSPRLRSVGSPSSLARRCEGPCLRSFHATKTSGKNYGCRSLGFTRGQRAKPFYCTNCTNMQHHCVGCRVLGSSDAANAQVFRCSHPTRGHLTCGRFYHPPCIGVELHPGDLAEAARCRDRVAAGGAFQCPGPHRRH